jgi:putative aldouronate transport system permease protein
MNLGGGTGNPAGLKQMMKMAAIIITTGPIILVYPFLQKYFVKGVLIGSIKG